MQELLIVLYHLLLHVEIVINFYSLILIIKFLKNANYYLKVFNKANFLWYLIIFEGLYFQFFQLNF